MRLADLDDGDTVVTKDYLDAKLSALQLEILKQIVASERAQRGWTIGLYAMVFGTYALIIAAEQCQ